jgi:hypothetical protein
MAARVLSCAFWLQRLSLLRWCTRTMAQHVFACATHRSLLDGISGLRLPDTAVYPRFSLLRTSREARGYACTSAPEGWGLHPHEDGVTRLCNLAACLEVRTSFQPTGHRPDLVNWLRVFGHAEVSRMGQGVGQPRHTRAVLSEQWRYSMAEYGVGMRVIATCLARARLMHCPRMSQYSPTTSRGSNDVQNSQPVLRLFYN